MVRYLDTGDGVDDNGGNPRTLRRQYLYATWGFPATAPNPAAFEVVFCIGTDPTATNTYLVPIQKTLGTDRVIQISVPISATLTGVNAFVRALYA